VISSANIHQAGEPNLRNDGPKLSASRRDTMCGGTISGREDLPRNDECGDIGPEILEEVGQAVKEYKCLLLVAIGIELVEAEAHDDENDCEHDESHELDRFSAPRVDEEEGGVVTRDKTSDGQNDVPYTDIVQTMECTNTSLRCCTTESDSLQDDRRVEPESVEGNIEGKPRIRCADDDLQVFSLGEVMDEVTDGRLRGLDTLNDGIRISIRISFGEEVFDIHGGLLNISLDIHGEARCLGDRQSEI